MISEKRQKQILDQVLNHCTPITARVHRQREHQGNVEGREPPNFLSDTEITKRMKAMEEEARKSPPPQSDEEWSLFFRLRTEYTMMLADRLDDEKEELEPLAVSGQKMRKAQAQRRSEWQAQRRDVWQAWQAWIDETMQAKKWSFEFTQSKAAEHFGCSLKSIQRRTQKPGQAD